MQSCTLEQQQRQRQLMRNAPTQPPRLMLQRLSHTNGSGNCDATFSGQLNKLFAMLQERARTRCSTRGRDFIAACAGVRHCTTAHSTVTPRSLPTRPQCPAVGGGGGLQLGAFGPRAKSRAASSSLVSPAIELLRPLPTGNNKTRLRQRRRCELTTPSVAFVFVRVCARADLK